MYGHFDRGVIRSKNNFFESRTLRHFYMATFRFALHFRVTADPEEDCINCSACASKLNRERPHSADRTVREPWANFSPEGANPLTPLWPCSHVYNGGSSRTLPVFAARSSRC